MVYIFLVEPQVYTSLFIDLLAVATASNDIHALRASTAGIITHE